LKYDPNKHHRHSIRLRGFDYGSAGAYFVTIVVRNRECVLGDVTPASDVRLSNLGEIVRDEWEALERRFPRLVLEEFVIMPNHIHGVLVIEGGGDDDQKAGEASATKPPSSCRPTLADASPLPAHGTQAGSLGAIVQNFKSVSSRRINMQLGNAGVPFWQRNYWEHVVRGMADLARIREYIQANPASWQTDELNPIEK
jgi:putative transposase